VIALLRVSDYILRHIGNADDTAMYFSRPCNYTVSNGGTKSMGMKTMGNYKLQVTVMFAVLADGSKLPTYMILSHKTLHKEQLPIRICQKWT
jgi:hypothetical protein